MSWKDSSFGIWYTTCWMGDSVTSVVQYRLFPFLPIPDSLSSDIGLAYLPLPILLIFRHCDIPLLFPVPAIPTRSAVSGPEGGNGAFKTSSSLRQFWGTLSPMVNLSPCGMPGGVLGADHWSLLSLTLGERKRRKQREMQREREREEQRENEPDKAPETDPSHSAEPREYAARLSAPLISQRQPPWQCDTDYWKPWFRLSLLLCVAANSLS